VSGAPSVGCQLDSAGMRYGRSGVEAAAPAPPHESVRSEKTIRPSVSQSSLNCSSVPMSTLSGFTPAARTRPPTGRSELCMNMTGSAVPATPPPATRTGAHGAAQRHSRLSGSRWRPEVA
jgi:hypothetical protein